MDTLGKSDIVLPLKMWYSTTIREKTECGNIYVTGNYDMVTGKLVQTHFHASKDAPQCVQAWGEAASRSISKHLRDGSTKIDIVRLFENIRCGKRNGLVRPGDALSCPDAIAKALSKLPKTMKIGEKIEDEGYINTQK